MKKEQIMPVSIAVVDDHKLFRRGLINLIHSLGDQYHVVSESANGKEFFSTLAEQGITPDIAILDIDMPVMNGFETAETLQQKYPDIKVLVITMVEDERTLIRMLKLGIKGYLSKDVEPEELQLALNAISLKGYHYTDHLTGRLIEAMQDHAAHHPSPGINDREQRFLELACSEYTYKEIADIMCLSIKTVDGYRNNLFEKLNVRSRVGLALYAIKNRLVTLP